MSALTEPNSDVTRRAWSGSSHRSGRGDLVLELGPAGAQALEVQVALGLVEAFAERRQLAPEVALVAGPGRLRPRHGRA